MSFAFAGPDRLLTRYRRTGDPRALGLLFDRAAPELLRVAAWLVGNRADAEDLLQRTFLTVIETRDAFDPSRRALPWLCGILGNHAKKLHEQRQRRIELTGERTGERDPAHAAADAEFAASVARVRAEIGTPYAEVLDLHLTEGLNAKDIAARLGRPAGTVRTQLVRALDLLRRRLPSGFVAGLALSAGANSASLATVRAAIVGRAEALVPAAGALTTAFTFGSLLMGKKIVVVIPAFVLLLGGGAWAILSSNDARATADPPLPVVANVAAPAAGAHEVVAAPLPATRDAAAIVDGIPADPDTATLIVRVTWEHDRSPASSVGVSVVPMRSMACFQERSGLADPSGSVVLRGIRPGQCAVSSPFSETRFLDVEAGSVHRLELEARRDGVIRGTVVDADERPVADARLWLSDRGTWSRGFEVGSSDANGRFETPVRVDQYLGARKAGYAPSRLRFLSSIPDEPLTVRLPAAGGAIRGRVFAVGGAPLANAQVQVGQHGGMGAPGSTTYEHYVYPTPELLLTDASGSFVADGVAAGSTEVRAWAADHGEVIESVLVTTGRTSEVVLTLPRGAIVEGVVRDAQQRPIAQAWLGVGGYGDFGSVRAESDDLGRFRLEHLPPGAVLVTAGRDEARERATLQLAPSQVTTWNPVLAVARELTGRLVDPDGRPLGGFEVGVIEGQPVPNRVATTDGDGRFAIAGVERGGDLMVQRDGQPIAQRGGVRLDRGDVVITLTANEVPSATIRGRVVDGEGKPVVASISIMNLGFPFGSGAETAADGTFRLGPLPATGFELSFEARGFGRVRLPAVSLAPGEERELPDVVLHPAGRVEVTLRGGSAPQSSFVKFARHDGTGVEWLMADGNHVAGDLAAGAYTAIAQLGADTAGSVAFVVKGKETVRVDLVGQPAAQVLLEYRGVGARSRGDRMRTIARDAAGAIADVIDLHLHVLDEKRAITARAHLPPGTFHLETTHSDGRVATNTLTVAAADDRPTAVIELPAK